MTVDTNGERAVCELHSGGAARRLRLRAGQGDEGRLRVQGRRARGRRAALRMCVNVCECGANVVRIRCECVRIWCEYGANMVRIWCEYDANV